MGSVKMAPLRIQIACGKELLLNHSVLVIMLSWLREPTLVCMTEIFDHFSCLVFSQADINVLEEIHQYYVQLPSLQFCLALLPVRMLSVLH